MLSFLGFHEHTLDNKGRVIVPACFRELLSGSFTVSLNADWSALAVYPAAKWANIWDTLSRIRDTDTVGMKYKRLILAHSVVIDSLDSQGRFILGRQIRSRAGLVSATNRVVIIGMGDYLEIWDEEKYLLKEAESIVDMAGLVEYVDGLGDFETK